MENYIRKTEGTSFREIVLAHIRKILEISSHELKNHSREVIRSNYTEKIIEEDTRMAYVSAVENLAYVLIPYFDKKANEVYKNCIKIMGGQAYEIRKDKKIDKEYSIAKNFYQKIGFSAFLKSQKLKRAKILFKELNLLLKRNNYLKEQIYSEEPED